MNNARKGAPKEQLKDHPDKIAKCNSFYSTPSKAQYQKSCSRFKNSTASLSHGFSFFIGCNSKVYQTWFFPVNNNLNSSLSVFNLNIDAFVH